MNAQPGIDPLVFIVGLIAIAVVTAFLVNFITIWGQITPSQGQIYGSHLEATLSIMWQNFHNWIHQLRGSAP